MQISSICIKNNCKFPQSVSKNLPANFLKLYWKRKHQSIVKKKWIALFDNRKKYEFCQSVLKRKIANFINWAQKKGWISSIGCGKKWWVSSNDQEIQPQISLSCYEKNRISSIDHRISCDIRQLARKKNR